MWLFLNDAYLSIVADRDDATRLLVRARFKGDLERVFGRVAVQETPTADYRFRAFVPRAAVAERIAKAVDSIAAPNFKASVKEDWRHDVYLKVWSTLKAAQDQRARRRAPSRLL